MFNQFGNSDHNFSDSRPNVRQSGAAVVYDVILDEENESIKDGEKDLSTIGAIRYREFGNLVSSEEDLSTAFPFNSFITELPVRNEIVEIFKSSTGKSFYRRIESSPFKTGATVSTFISKTFPKQSSFNGASSDYQRVQSTGIERRNTTTSDVYDGYGDYFQHEFAKRLKLYEGDTLLESRFGQSIRFSAYNNDNKVFSPTLILRNKENSISADINNNETLFRTTEEDINRDGSIIFLGSNEHKLPFIAGTVNDKNIGDFETRPQSFSQYPSELLGDQILINSGRIILSAKNAEMIFYSKKNYGFISDGGLSIDNKLGMTINLGDHSNITTNGRDININTGSTGKINLGAGALESMVKGDTLLLLMQELITQIQLIIVATPAGPSSPPINAAAFQSISTRLNTILSRQNKTV
jgi:hypothetical protein